MASFQFLRYIFALKRHYPNRKAITINIRKRHTTWKSNLKSEKKSRPNNYSSISFVRLATQKVCWTSFFISKSNINNTLIIPGIFFFWSRILNCGDCDYYITSQIWSKKPLSTPVHQTRKTINLLKTYSKT